MAILVAAIWGFNFVVVKTGLKEIPPFLYGASRFVIAAIPSFFFAKPDLSWRIIGGIGLTLGVLKFSLMFTGIYLGMSAGLASLVLQSQIFFTVVFSTFIFGHRVQGQQIVGMVVAFSGIALIGWETGAETSLIGFLLILGSAIAWSISNILYQKAGQVDMLALTSWSSVIPPLPMFICSLLVEGSDVVVHTITSLTWIGVVCLLFTSCASTLVGATLWGELLKNYEAPKVAPFSLLIPLFGITFAWLIIDEQLSSTTLLACAMVFSGLVINQWRSLTRLFSKTPEVVVQVAANQNYDKAA